MKVRIWGTSAGIAVRIVVAIVFILDCDTGHTPPPCSGTTMRG
jgi:hypothetical protein